MRGMIVLLFGLLGWLAGVTINVLADDLPLRQRPSNPLCPSCGHGYHGVGWSGIGRWVRCGGRCPGCGRAQQRRPVVVEVGTAVLFAALPLLIADPIVLAVDALYMAILVLIIVIDLEHRLILNVVVYPATLLALALSLLVPPGENGILLALVGTAVGFVLFYALYWLGGRLFGRGALGFGDVKLAMLLGAMLGFHRILFALFLAIVLGGVVSVVLLVSGRARRRTVLPYGQYLAIAGMVLLIWGGDVLAWYLGS